jgi:hypothetical protein
MPIRSHDGQSSGVVLVLGGVARISPSDADLTVREGFAKFPLAWLNSALTRHEHPRSVWSSRTEERAVAGDAPGFRAL